MIRRCPNCAGQVTFDVNKQSLVCDSCGSAFKVDEFASDEVINEAEPIKVETSDDSHKLDNTYQSNIFTCNACGAEISVTSTEASTFCIYCGNSTVVFSRIANIQKPELIIPFKVTKEEAMAKVRERITKGFYIPKEIKNYELELIRGIYIPYYVTKVEYDGSYIISSEQKSGKHNHTYYHKRSAYASMPWITTDASKTLSDTSSQRLEPYDVTTGVEFDENYLLGFYSDVSDVIEKDAIYLAKHRGREVFEEAILKDVPGSNKKIVDARRTAEVFDKPVTAMLPAWFLTFRYNDQPYTIIVNGQTGKIVGGVPWNKPLFSSVATGLAIAFAILFAIIGALIFSDAEVDGDAFKFIIFVLIIGGVLIYSGISKINRVIQAIELTSASTLNSYVNKRQKGN